jgi:rhamnose transport system ATP-binding protein
MSTPVLRLHGLAKSFGGVRALESAALELHTGVATALIGENGAGKSTLVKILTGVYVPDAGTIEVAGAAVTIRSPIDAGRLGISVIHQESVVFDELSVAENIYAASPPLRGARIAWTRMRADAAALLHSLGSRINPRALLGELSIAGKHLVQIARALASDARIVVMDEPTAALSQREADELLAIVRRLKSEGRAILYISHRFEEVLDIAERYTVLRDGSTVGAGNLRETNLDALIQLMAGRPLGQIFPKVRCEIGAEVLRVEGLCAAPEFRDVSFSLRRGEILGVYGLVGAGRSELMQTLFGLQTPDAGRITLAGHALRLRSPADAIRAGIACVPEDRQHQGAILGRSIRDNIALPNLPRLARGGFTQRRAERATAAEWVQRLQVRCRDTEQHLQELSGGNQQKVVLARWLETRPQVLIVDEPTKGIDVGSKAAVHRTIGELAAGGMAIIMVSSELPEILGMSDRILVMRRGLTRALFDRANASAEQILRAATDA